MWGCGDHDGHYPLATPSTVRGSGKPSPLGERRVGHMQFMISRSAFARSFLLHVAKLACAASFRRCRLIRFSIFLFERWPSTNEWIIMNEKNMLFWLLLAHPSTFWLTDSGATCTIVVVVVKSVMNPTQTPNIHDICLRINANIHQWGMCLSKPSAVWRHSTFFRNDYSHWLCSRFRLRWHEELFRHRVTRIFLASHNIALCFGWPSSPEGWAHWISGFGARNARPFFAFIHI